MAAILHESRNGVLTIRIKLRLLDETTIQQVYKEITSVVENTEAPNVLIDFGEVDFLSSSALGMLIRIHKKCKESRTSLKLSGISPSVREVFKITGLEKIFQIYPETPAAIQAFGDGPDAAGSLARIEPLGPDPRRPYGGPIDRELRQRGKKELDE